MDLCQAIKGRRSIRNYNDESIDKEILYKIIEAGTWAPSACNIQGWKYIILDSPDIFQMIYKAGSASFMKNVKQAIVVLYENQTDNVEYQDHIQSAAASIQNMILMAYSLGVGSWWVNNLPDKKKLRKILNVPSTYDPIAIVTLGYFDKKPNNRERKYAIQDVISYNTFEFDNVCQKSKAKVIVKRFCRKVYKKLPAKTFLLKFVGKMEKKFDN